MIGGTLAVHTTTALLLILASQAGDGGCEPVGTPGYACHVETRGLAVDGGLVTDRVRNWCGPGTGPLEQTFLTWIETRRNPDDTWLLTGRSELGRGIPDPEGYVYRLRDGRCQPDVEYNTAWRASGTGPDGVGFDTGIVRQARGVTDLC